MHALGIEKKEPGEVSHQWGESAICRTQASIAPCLSMTNSDVRIDVTMTQEL